VLGWLCAVTGVVDALTLLGASTVVGGAAGAGVVGQAPLDASGAGATPAGAATFVGEVLDVSGVGFVGVVLDVTGVEQAGSAGWAAVAGCVTVAARAPPDSANTRAVARKTTASTRRGSSRLLLERRRFAMRPNVPD
jgi:hypothetical protein